MLKGVKDNFRNMFVKALKKGAPLNKLGFLDKDIQDKILNSLY